MTADSPSTTAAATREAYLRLQVLGNRQAQQVATLLKSQNLSLPQYNVLRILRGGGEDGVTCSGISERLIVNDPDVTRLLDRLEKADLIRRERHPTDRRAVLSFITPQGLDTLRVLDEPLAQLHAEQFAALTPAQLSELTSLLDRLI